MNYKMMGKFIGLLLMVESIFMLPALLISLCRQERSSAMAFTAAIVILWGLGMLLRFFLPWGQKEFLRQGGPGMCRAWLADYEPAWLSAFFSVWGYPQLCGRSV